MSRNEVIIVVNRSELFEDESLSFQGSMFDNDVVNTIMGNIKSNYTSMRRGNVDEVHISANECAERNFAYKQPIPYIVVHSNGKFFVTERLEGGGETRLHGKLSMGIGGHMNPVDVDNFDELLQENTMREFNEELNVELNGQSLNIKMGGLVNDDENEVGEVHIGLLGVADLQDGQNVTVREVEQLKGHWFTLGELLSEDVYSRLEAWGQITVDAINSGELKI